jgi:NAD-dependent SIR2 family protein deacetylase
MNYRGRAKPYTTEEIKKARCARCGEPSQFQWQACANEHRYSPLCADCDYRLNELALRFMRIKNADALLAAYAKKLGVDPNVTHG